MSHSHVEIVKMLIEKNANVREVFSNVGENFKLNEYFS